MNATRFRLWCAAGVGTLVAVFAQASHAASCDGFVDVDSGASYCAAVTYVKNRGVTVGCTDSTHYCPNDNVTRAQMALYLQRMGQADPSNTLGDNTTAIGGGQGNTVTGAWSVIAGGLNNNVSAGWSAIAGGYANQLTGTGGFSAVSGGYYNSANGKGSVVPGGAYNAASGDYSFAAGTAANADQEECVVFSFWSGASGGLSCLSVANVFRIGADHGFSVDYHTERSDGGGTRWVAIGDTSPGQTIATWNGAYLSDGGTWTNASDRAAKENFTTIDSAQVLAKIAAMPITQWQYKREPTVSHIGPVAQDFHAAFGLGSNDISISTVDEEGVALAAIQGLNAKVEARDAVISEQARQLAQFRDELRIVQSALAEMRAVSATSAPVTP